MSENKVDVAELRTNGAAAIRDFIEMRTGKRIFHQTALGLYDVLSGPLLDQLEQSGRDLDIATRENANLRLIHQKVGCPYGHGNAESGCSLGYPGCACMDDVLAMAAWAPEDEDKAAVRLGQRLKASEALVARLREALEPFANVVDWIVPDWADGLQVVEFGEDGANRVLKAGHFRAARQALQGE